MQKGCGGRTRDEKGATAEVVPFFTAQPDECWRFRPDC